MNHQDVIAAKLEQLNGGAAITLQMQQLIDNDQLLQQEIAFIESLWQNQQLEEQPSAALDARFYQMLNQAQAAQSQQDQALMATQQKQQINVADSLPTRLYHYLQGLFTPKPLMQFALMAAVFTVGYQWQRPEAMQMPDQNQLVVAQLQQQVSSLNSLVALSMINSQSASKRLAGIKYGAQSVGQDPQLNHALIQLLRNDSSSSIRLSALDVLAQNEMTLELESELINSFKRQSLIVQIKLIDLLLAHGSSNVQTQFTPGTQVYQQLLPEAREFLQDLSNQQI